MRRVRNQRGQTASEYLGLLLVVVTLVGLLSTSDLGKGMRSGIGQAIDRVAGKRAGDDGGALSATAQAQSEPGDAAAVGGFAPDAVARGGTVLKGLSPDGDSLRFAPSPGDRAALERLPGPPPEFNEDGSVQLRFLGVDALELHYQGRAQAGADVAADALLDLLGVTEVTRDPETGEILRVEPESVAITVAATGVDRYGRPLSLVFPGEDPVEIGEDGRIAQEVLERSANYQLVRRGEAFPSAYADQPDWLNEALREAARAARDERVGVWRDYRSQFRLSEVDEVTILPKLYRRVVEFQQEREGAEEGFVEWLRNSDSDDEILVDGRVRRLSEVLTEQDGRVTLTVDPIDITDGVERANP